MSGNRIVWLTTADPPDSFPPIDTALSEPEGLLAAGGDLSSERLVQAYRLGIFPWYEDGQPILWWSPDPRCVLIPADFHISRRLRRDIQTSTAEITVNRSFGEVVAACAAPRPSQQGTWITEEMIEAYSDLHGKGWAHSLEVRDRDQLIGGIYGIAIGRVFFGESMFSAGPNGSKFALFALSQLLDAADFALIDCQVVSAHLQTLGATTIARSEFAALLEESCNPPSAYSDWPEHAVSLAELLPD